MKIEFGEELSKEGVVDGRGVVGLEYGTPKGQDGTLKSYGVRSFRYPGESGKTWFLQRKANGVQLIESPHKIKPEEVVELR